MTESPAPKRYASDSESLIEHTYKNLEREEPDKDRALEHPYEGALYHCGQRGTRKKLLVCYHPATMKPAEVAHLKVPVQIHLGTADRHIPVADVKELENVFRKQRTPVEVFLYEGADHGFLAYTRPYYKVDAAQLSWERTLLFLNKYLKKYTKTGVRPAEQDSILSE